jgi:D-alanyl-D-alanine dipeptidase
MAHAAHAGAPPRGFVDAATVIPDLVVEMRYTTPQNFMGRPIPGYKAPRCYLTKPAADALKCAADGLRGQGYALKVYDCYRPQRAVNAFVAWGRDLRDQKMKQAYYPDVDKRNLFHQNYIASRSGHSRGSTVDLSMVPLERKVTLESGPAIRRPAPVPTTVAPTWAPVSTASRTCLTRRHPRSARRSGRTETCFDRSCESAASTTIVASGGITPCGTNPTPRPFSTSRWSNR